MTIELVSTTTDGSTGITGSKASLLIITSKHSVETGMTLSIMGAVVKEKNQNQAPHKNLKPKPHFC